MDNKGATENRKRLRDLRDRSYRNSQYTFTDFLGLADLSEFYDMTRLPSSNPLSIPAGSYKVYGGYEQAERCMIRFGDAAELLYEQEFPIVCICISPLQKKFADDLSHRDFLGALMNLGIERNELGDLLVKEAQCYLFSTEKMADYICKELTRVKHTSVMAVVSAPPKEIFEPTIIDKTIQAKSQRIDGVVAKICNLSRSKTAELFMAKKVFVNGRLMENESRELKPEDVVVVRGFGKFVFKGCSGNTRKGNLIIDYQVYV